MEPSQPIECDSKPLDVHSPSNDHRLRADPDDWGPGDRCSTALCSARVFYWLHKGLTDAAFETVLMEMDEEDGGFEAALYVVQEAQHAGRVIPLAFGKPLELGVQPPRRRRRGQKRPDHREAQPRPSERAERRVRTR